MYAVIKTGGKQYSVKVGDVVYVEKLNAEDNSEVTFDQVLAVGEEGSFNKSRWSVGRCTEKAHTYRAHTMRL